MRVPGLVVLTLFAVIFISSPITDSPMEAEMANTFLLAQTEIPSARFLPDMVYDPVNERVMLFGGGYGDAELDDTWVLDYETGTWTELALSTSPTPRSSHVMVYDSNSEVIILFGGYNGSSPARDTWVFNCTSEMWAEVTPEMSPPERMSHAMVYDSVNGRAILFSGYGPDGPEVDDTWAYDYTTNSWEEMNPVASPHARYGAAHVYDEVNETMIIFGGNSQGYFSDTWSYDYSTDTWSELSPATHPIPLKWSSMTYDSVNQKSVLFGGDINHPIVSNETWIFDSAVSEWEESESTIAPSSRQAFGFAFDPGYEKAILFGGTKGTGQASDTFNETWAYDYTTDSWTKVEHEIGEIPTPIDPVLILGTITLGTIALVIVAVYFKKK
jgi:N-acetylneuraminic acid mutarotase